MYTWMSEIDPVGRNRVNLVYFHDLLLVILLFVVIFVSGMIGFVLKNKSVCKVYYEKKKLEFIWTVIPIFIVRSIFVPSILLLKNQSKVADLIDRVVKVIGHQWNWEYDYQFKGETLNYVSVSEEKNWNRLLSVRAPLFVNGRKKTLIKVLSEDVIHSFRIPELSLKVDAVPGRVKEIILRGQNNVGVFSGQCSEICGILHSKMPIELILY